MRLRVLEDAGRSNVAVHDRHPDRHRRDARGPGRVVVRAPRGRPAVRHVQEVIIQNFRAKPDTAMRARRRLRARRVRRDGRGRAARARAADARPGAAEPRRPDRVRAAARRRRRRLGRRVAADARPRQPRAAVAADRRSSPSVSSDAGFALARAADGAPARTWRRAVAGPAAAAARRRAAPTRHGLARPTCSRSAGRGRSPTAAGRDAGRADLHAAIDTEGRRTTDRGRLRRGLRRLGGAAGQRRGAPPRQRGAGSAVARHGRSSSRRCGPPSATPRGCPTPRRSRCSTRRRAPSSTRCAALADDLRRDAVGDDVTYVVNRNINFTNVCYTGCRFCAFAQRRTDADAYTLSLDEVGEPGRRGVAAGATEVCMQGGIHPDLPGHGVLRPRRRGEAARSRSMHVHAFSPMEVVNGAARTGLSIARLADRSAKEAGRRLDARAPRPRSSTTTSAGC